MASSKNDALLERTVEGSVNYYCNHKCKGTANDRGLAERLGGHSYNILSNSDKHEIYLRDLRPPEHYLDSKGRHTVHFFGSRRRKFAGDERGHVQECLMHQDVHPRERARRDIRLETQLAQLENSNSYGGFQQRMSPQPPQPKRYTIDNARYANEKPKLRPSVTSKAEWLGRRGRPMSRSASCPSLSVTDPAGSLCRAVRDDLRKDVSQRQLESAHFAPRMSANTLAMSMDAVPLGREVAANHRSCSVNRAENYDFAITRKNNHYSSQDKHTRADPFYMRPRFGITNNSVKYDIVNNESRWFKY